jgi:hypothetical protein
LKVRGRVSSKAGELGEGEEMGFKKKKRNGMTRDAFVSAVIDGNFEFVFTGYNALPGIHHLTTSH